MRRLGLAAAALLVAGLVRPGGSPADPAPADAPRPVEAIERDLVLLLQEEPVPVRASAALCQPQALPPDGGDEEVRRWYFGDAGCELTYAPRADALVTSATDGVSRRFLESPARVHRLEELLAELDGAAAAAGLSPLRRLLVHSTAWEVAFGLKRSLAFHPEWEPAGGPSVERSLRVLARTRFSERDLAALPATLAGLAQGASAPPLASTVAALLRHDPGYLELSPATHLHAEVLAGRFSPRIFLTVADAAERQAFRNYVEAAKTTNQGLAELPHRFAGVHAVLVLFFNVFRDDGTIAATPVVAFWQEYALSDRTAYELPFAEMARRIRFYTVEGVRGGAADPLRYQTVDPLRMTTRTFLDVKPTIPGVEVTTLRAHCLACHLTRVATFDTHGMRRTSFTPPLVRAEREVLTPFYQVFEGRLRQWMDEYHVNSSPGPSR